MDSKNEFFPLLNNALYKEETNVSEDIITNSDMYMFLRYTSFYHHNLVNHINMINKKMKMMTTEDSGKYLFQVLKSSLPKLNKNYFRYIAKKSLKQGDKVKSFVEEYSKRHNISQAKVWEMLYLVNQIENKNG